jgi:hypothetical protein
MFGNQISAVISNNSDWKSLDDDEIQNKDEKMLVSTTILSFSYQNC